MKQSVVAGFVLATAFSMTLSAFAATLEKTEKCALQIPKNAFDNTNIYNTTLRNNEVVIKCEFRGGEFCNKFTLFAIPRLTNLTGRSLNVSYQVTCFDGAGKVIAVAQQKGDLKSDAVDWQFGSALISISREEFKKIVCYNIVVSTE